MMNEKRSDQQRKKKKEKKKKEKNEIRKKKTFFDSCFRVGISFLNDTFCASIRKQNRAYVFLQEQEKWEAGEDTEFFPGFP